jgi:hypothetical protein
MHRKILSVTLGAGLLATAGIAAGQAQQGSSATRTGEGVLSARPIRSEAMVNLQRAAQRLRESIQSLVQEPVGTSRDQALSAARDALYDTQQAMIRLPPEYRTSGIVISNVPILRTSPAQNWTVDDAMKELQLAAERLRQSIQAMADRPAGQQRNDAIKQAHQALFQTHQAMAMTYGERTASTTASGGTVRSGAQGTMGRQTGVGGVSGSSADGTTGASSMSDAARLQGGASAVGGGVGINARDMLASQADPDHNVKMVFSLNTGNYLANVDVKVKNAQGRTVLEGVSDGPWVFAKLPTGKYTANATYNGHTVTRSFTVGKSGDRVAHFRWPASVEENMISGVSPILGTGPQESR